MRDSCPTTKVVSDNEQGFVLINTSDFNPDVHTEYVAPAEPETPAPTPAPEAPVVTKFAKAK